MSGRRKRSPDDQRQPPPPASKKNGSATPRLQDLAKSVAVSKLTADIAALDEERDELLERVDDIERRRDMKRRELEFMTDLVADPVAKCWRRRQFTSRELVCRRDDSSVEHCAFVDSHSLIAGVCNKSKGPGSTIHFWDAESFELKETQLSFKERLGRIWSVSDSLVGQIVPRSDTGGGRVLAIDLSVPDDLSIKFESDQVLTQEDSDDEMPIIKLCSHQPLLAQCHDDDCWIVNVDNGTTVKTKLPNRADTNWILNSGIEWDTKDTNLVLTCGRRDTAEVVVLHAANDGIREMSRHSEHAAVYTTFNMEGGVVYLWKSKVGLVQWDPRQPKQVTCIKSNYKAPDLMEIHEGSVLCGHGSFLTQWDLRAGKELLFGSGSHPGRECKGPQYGIEQIWLDSHKVLAAGQGGVILLDRYSSDEALHTHRPFTAAEFSEDSLDGGVWFEVSSTQVAVSSLEKIFVYDFQKSGFEA